MKVGCLSQLSAVNGFNLESFFTDAVAEVVKLGATDFSFGGDFDFSDPW